MANEELTIAKEQSRLSVIGRSYADVNTDSGDGDVLFEDIIDWLIDNDFPVPDIDDWDGIPAIIGLDDGIPTIWYIDPDTGDLSDWSLSDLDWNDLTADLDLGWELDFNFSIGDLNVSVDDEFDLKEDNLPHSIVIVTEPNKLTYTSGKGIDITGMVVTAKKEDGTTWTSAKYPNGHIPLRELIITPNVAMLDVNPADHKASLDEVNSMQYSWGPYGGYWPNIIVWNSFGPLQVYFSGLDAQTGSPITLSWNDSRKQYVGNIDLNGHADAPIYGPATMDGTSLVPYGEDHKTGKVITVSWKRPEDGELLSTTFEITVTPGGGGR